MMSLTYRFFSKLVFQPYLYYTKLAIRRSGLLMCLTCLNRFYTVFQQRNSCPTQCPTLFLSVQRISQSRPEIRIRIFGSKNSYSCSFLLNFFTNFSSLKQANTLMGETISRTHPPCLCIQSVKCLATYFPI